MKKSPIFLDLFAGAGGLSEGFIRAGFSPLAHVEMDPAACFTLKTRMAYHWLKKQGCESDYYDYLHGRVTRSQLYQSIPEKETVSVVNAEISKDTIKNIFNQIDSLLDGKSVDLIIGGPPCQSYSLVGRSRDKNKMKDDKRNYLYTYYAEFLKKYQPRYFVFENVTGLLSAKSQEGALHLDGMLFMFSKAGYETEYKLLSADRYGVLQSRKRIILIGKRGWQAGFYPDFDSCKKNGTLVSELFSDLPTVKAGKGGVKPCRMKKYNGEYLYKSGIKNDDTPVTWHISRPHSEQDLEIYEIVVKRWNEKKERLNYNDLPKRLKTHKNRKSFTDRFKVVAGDLPASHTVVAHISKDGHYYIHPDIKQNRSLTPREAARLQTFPDDYFFESVSETPGRTAAFKQIGNAVPVLLAQKIAEKLRKMLS